jgi:hypothetical protein
MYTGDTSCHSSTIQVNVEAVVAFDYLKDGVAQGDWALGSMQRRKIGDDLYSGTSIFSGAELFIRIDADSSRFTIYYHVGFDLDDLQARNMVRVIPGTVVGRTDAECLVTLLTWRSENVDEDKWKLTCVSHETEMFIIKNRLEQAPHS